MVFFLLHYSFLPKHFQASCFSKFYRSVNLFPVTATGIGQRIGDIYATGRGTGSLKEHVDNHN